MWKLTITQKTKSEYGYYNTNEVELTSDSLITLLMLVEKVAAVTGDLVTSFKVEKVEKEEGNQDEV